MTEPGDAAAPPPPPPRQAAPAGEGVAVPTARAVLEHVVGSLVQDPSAVRIDTERGRNLPRLTVRVGPSDMGRVIGKRGRVAQAIRTVTRAAAARDGSDVEVEFED